MEDLITLEISGLSELQEALKMLPDFLARKVVTKVNKDVVQKLVVSPLRDSVVYSPKTESRIRTTTAGLQKNSDELGAVLGGVTSDAFWIRFAQRGTGARYTKRGAFKGQIVGKNQMQPIVLNSVDDIIAYAAEQYSKDVEAELTKRLKSTTKKLLK